MKYLYFIIPILFLLNLFLLHTNVERQDTINALNAQLIFHEDKMQTHVAKFSPVPGAIELPASGLYLVIVFTDQGCVSCLSYEIPNAEKFINSFGSNSLVYLVSHNWNTEYLNRHGAGFSYTAIESHGQLIETDYAFINTAAFIVDASGIIHDVYLAETGNREKSERFYQRMNSLFNSISKSEPEAF